MVTKPVIVRKAGGFVTRDAENIMKFAKIVCAYYGQQIIVPSAPRGVTDMLYRYTALRHNSPHKAEQQRIEIRDLYLDILSGLDVRDYLRVELCREFNDITIWQGSKDALVSRGEYWIGWILAKYLGLTFFDAKRLVRFDTAGRFDMVATRANAPSLHQVLRGSKGVVVPGFYGLDPEGQIKLDERNGTDREAIAIAVVVNASRCEIWKDTSVRAASPKIVSYAERVPYMNYKEARALTDRGSEVVFSDAVLLAEEADLSIYVRDLNDPDHPGTIIESTDFVRQQDVEQGADELRRSGIGVATGISGRVGMSVLTLTMSGMHEATGVAAKFLSMLADHGIRIHHTPDGIDSFSVVVETEEVGTKLQKINKDMRVAFGSSARLKHHSNFAIVSIVGRAFGGVKNRIRALQALEGAGIEPQPFGQGVEPHFFTLCVEEPRYEDAVKALYHKFFTTYE